MKVSKPVHPDSFDLLSFELWIKYDTATMPAGNVIIEDSGNPSNFHINANGINVLDVAF